MQSMWAIGMQLVALGCFCKSANAATASDLYLAMEVDSSDVSTSAVTGSSTAYDTTSALGVFVPEMGSDMSILHTGIVGSNPQSGTDLGTYGPTGDQTTLTLELTVPSTANSFSLSFAFFSAEYPEYVGSVYNDAF